MSNTDNLARGGTAGRTFPAEPLTMDEMRSLLDCAMYSVRPAWTAHRSRAALVLMWRGGLRASEALSVERRDIDFDAGTVRVRDGKGGTTATVGIDPDGLSILRQWEHERSTRGGTPNEQWLRVPGRNEWTYFAMNMHMKRLAKRAGIAKRVSCHQFRHTMAAQMADEGVDIRIISTQLRHSSVDTTHRYVNHLKPADVIEAVAKRPGFLTTTTEG
jgi:integrase